MSVEIEGLDNLADFLNDISGENTVSMDELFTKGFMATNTEFESISEFFDKSPWSVESQEDFEQIPQEKFDAYVDKHTGFNSWEAMMKAAAREWITRQVNL